MACTTCGAFDPLVSSCCCSREYTQCPTALRSSCSIKFNVNLANRNTDIGGIQKCPVYKDTPTQQNLSSDKSSPTAVYRLPNELLAEIFFSRSASSTPALFLDLHNDGLWSILQVCTLWRDVARSTPMLWNTFLIDLTNLKGKALNYACLFTRLQTCLTHSGALPLNFALTGTHYEDSTPLIPLITTLCTYAHKWSNVYFCPYTTNILATWLPAFRQLSTPLLTSLGLTSFNPSPGLIQTPTRLTHTPNLARLALYDYRMCNTDSSFLPSFRLQITHLYLDSCPYYTYTGILPHLPSLIYLEILNKYQHSARTLDTTPIPLPHLRTFRATGWLGNLCFLLPYLELPSIERLDITALEEQCYPCACAVVKRRVINEWIDVLRKDVDIKLNYVLNFDWNLSADDGILRFLFSDLN